MPYVSGKKYSYDKAGMKAAAKARKNIKKKKKVMMKKKKKTGRG